MGRGGKSLGGQFLRTHIYFEGSVIYQGCQAPSESLVCNMLIFNMVMSFQETWPRRGGKYGGLSRFGTDRVWQLVVLGLWTAVSTDAATFYIDSVSGSDANTSAQAQSQSTPWRFMPGQFGATGNSGAYSPQPGDVFVFKGGSTWTIASGTDDMITVPSSGITILGGQQLIPPWGSGYPVLNGGGSTLGRNCIYSYNNTSIVIDGLEITNFVYSGDGSGAGMFISGDVSNWEIRNCLLDSDGVNAITAGPLVDGANFSIHNNTIRNCGRTGFGLDDVAFDNLNIYSNNFAGLGNWPAHSFHGDGLIIGANQTSYPSKFTHINIHHNKFYGDWSQGATALIYLNDGAGPVDYNHAGGYHCMIYDNQLCVDSDGQLSPGIIVIVNGWKDVKILNNTFDVYSAANVISACVMAYYLNADATLICSNNIFSGTQYAISASELVSGPTGLCADYNLYNTLGKNRLILDKNSTYDTLSTARAKGYELHGISGLSPQFVTAPNGVSGHGNWALQSSSPAIAAGVPINSMFNTDIVGVSRGTSWDIGAYAFTGVSTRPTPPVGLKILSSSGQ